MNHSTLLMNEEDAAKMLSISPRKHWGLRDDGEIAYVKSGRSVRYAVADLKAWIQQNKRLPTASEN